MAGVVYELRDIIEQQRECYEGLCILAEHKMNAVINKKIDFLTQVVEREEEFVGRLNVLDSQREQLMNDIAIVTGMSTKDITLLKIVQKIGEDTEVAKNLMKDRATILERIEELKKKNHINKAVLEQSMEFVDFTLNAIKTTQYTQTNVGYVRPGMDQELESISTFDQRQ